MNLYIDFFIFVNYIQLMGRFDSVLQGIQSLLSSRTALLPEHIRTTVQLPCGHPLRSLIAQACVKSYVWSLQLSGRNRGRNRRRFKFQEELDTLEGFASDLVRAFTSSIRGNPRFIDPLSKKYLDPYQSSCHSYHLPRYLERF